MTGQSFSMDPTTTLCGQTTLRSCWHSSRSGSLMAHRLLTHGHLTIIGTLRAQKIQSNLKCMTISRDTCTPGLIIRQGIAPCTLRMGGCKVTQDEFVEKAVVMSKSRLRVQWRMRSLQDLDGTQMQLLDIPRALPHRDGAIDTWVAERWYH